jgi:cytochrome c553
MTIRRLRRLHSARLVLCLAATLLVTVCLAASGGERVPARLSETGLYASGRVGVINPENRPFSPQYPLWTDGAAKQRWVYLPPGSTIDASDVNRWDFPVGTRFWKQFEFNGRKVETRMLWRSSRARWVFASYQWLADGSDAVLASSDGVPGVAALSTTRQHSIPSVNDCGACHGAERAGPLGFNALQLSPARDPNAIHGEPLLPTMITLRTLVEEKRVTGAGALLKDPPRIRTESPQTRTALGYLLANCGSCHNGRGEIAALGPTLKYEELQRDADDVARGLVGQVTKWQVPGAPEGHSVLIDPAALERSALLVRMRSRSPSSQMPPLGTVIRDTVALELLTQWAASLK